MDLIYVDEVTSQQLLSAPVGKLVLKGREIPVPRPEYLIAMKVHAMKNDPSRTFKELADIQFLMSLPGINLEEVSGYFDAAGMKERFNELQKIR